MIDRRHFMGGVLGLAFGDPAVARTAGVPSLADDPAYQQYRSHMARCDLRVLGVPRRRSLVEEGLHPVAPDRVVVVDDAEVRRFAGQHRGLKRRFRDQSALRQGEQLPSGKGDLVVSLMDRLTGHYRRPDLFGPWSRTLWRRELLGSTGIGHGLGLLHDFQPHGKTVRTDNAVLDWWLVLLPGGIDWQAFDDRPVHFMVGPVMEDRQPGNYLRVMEGISRGLRPLVLSDGFDPAAWANRLASLSAVDAAREFNFMVAHGLGGSGSR